MNKDKLKELKYLLNDIYWQGTSEGSEYSCGIDEDKINAVIDWITSNFISKEWVKKEANNLYPLKNQPKHNKAVLKLNNI